MNAQQLIIGHVLPIAAAIAVLWVVYRLLFSNSNRIKFNRVFLLSSLLFALALPLIGVFVGHESQQMVTWKQNLFGGTMLTEITITPEGQEAMPEMQTEVAPVAQPRLTVWQIVGGLYIIGVGVMTLLFLFKLGRLMVLIIRSPKRKMKGYTAIFTGREQGSFSFFRYAFFPNENVSPDIVRHEVSHIEHHHSWDILFTEVMMILQWFNPFIYLYKKELQSVHEYQADRDVVATGIDKKNYMMLIVQQCTAADFSGMSNNFSLILTKKRIKMITRNEKAKGLWWRLLATLPVLAILLIANTKATAQEEKMQITVSADTYQIVMYEYEGDEKLPVNDTVIYNEDGSYSEVKREQEIDPETNKPRTKVMISSYDKDGQPAKGFHIQTIPTEQDDMVEYKITPNEGFVYPVQTINVQSNDSVYQIVDEMPQFQGGDQAMFTYLSENIKYPEEAKDKGIAGRVFISFVVEKDGSVSNVEVKRGIGGGCDDEAVRVVKAMPKWKPGKKDGKPVRVSYMLPIVFKLDTPKKVNTLVGSVWEGTGTGTKNDVTYTWHSVLQFNSENEGLLIEKLVSQKKNEDPVVEFENVAMDFEYAFDGKKTGAITPKNGDGTYMDELPPEGFILHDDGKTITLNFYTATDDTGIKFVTYTRK